MEEQTSVTAAPRRQLGLARSIAWGILGPIARQAAHSYIAGPALDDALGVRHRFASAGVPVTIGYFNWAEDSPRAIADHNLAALRALAGTRDYVSIKLPTLHDAPDLLAELTQAAAAGGIRLHMDSLQPETADRTWATIAGLLSGNVNCKLGFTVAARWRRAVDDVRLARRYPLSIRVVKGEWADPHDPGRDPRAGFLEVIDELARGAHHVAVASHDGPLAVQALSKLRAAGVSCELELLYGLPMRHSFAIAQRLKVPVRVYIPFGEAMLRYGVNAILRHPKIALYLAKDFLGSFAGPAAFARSLGRVRSGSGPEA